MELALYLTDVLRDILAAYLLMHPLAPAVDKFEALVYSRITLDAPVDKPLYLFYGHTRLFQALYNRKPLNILVFEHSYSAARALDKRQRSRSRRGNPHLRHSARRAVRDKQSCSREQEL